MPLVGAGLFVSSVVLGTVSFYANKRMDKFQFLRDSCFLFVAVSLLTGFLADKVINIYESLAFIATYVIYGSVADFECAREPHSFFRVVIVVVAGHVILEREPVGTVVEVREAEEEEKRIVAVSLNIECVDSSSSGDASCAAATSRSTNSDDSGKGTCFFRTCACFAHLRS